ncbi:MAG: hypothetical protein MJ222_01930 [Bacilli bacterium]|nr:hypothetical protein [Bacilli bacterium]
MSSYKLRKKIKRKPRYYIYDEIDGSVHKCKTKKEFMNSMLYNREIAKEYGDSVRSKKTTIHKFNKRKDYDESFNGFGYAKATHKSLKWFGYK